MSVHGMMKTVFVTELKAIQPDISDAALKYIEQSLEQFKQERDALAAQVEVLQALVKEEAHEAYWDASDSNRADRMDDRFDDSVREQFEKYWASRRKESLTPADCLAQVKSDAGRAGYLQGHLDALGDPDEIDKEHSSYRADQYAERIRQGGE